jgi:hypothetical protein
MPRLRSAAHACYRGAFSYRDREVCGWFPNSLTTAYIECERLWLVWDQIWWMDFHRVGIRDFRNAMQGYPTRFVAKKIAGRRAGGRHSR